MDSMVFGGFDATTETFESNSPPLSSPLGVSSESELSSGDVVGGGECEGKDNGEQSTSTATSDIDRDSSSSSQSDERRAEDTDISGSPGSPRRWKKRLAIAPHRTAFVSSLQPYVIFIHTTMSFSSFLTARSQSQCQFVKVETMMYQLCNRIVGARSMLCPLGCVVVSGSIGFIVCV